MSLHMLKPTLYENPVLDIAYNNWDKFHIWLHKPPLFMWQSAVFFKMFGYSEFVFRIPNVLLGAVTVYGIYRSGKLLINHATGFFAVVLFCSSQFFVHLLSGSLSTDQNDYSFFAYTSLSIWSFVEYQTSQRKSWLIATAVFSGCAVLCKWLLGLFVYALWFLYTFLVYRFQFKKYLPIVIAFLVTLVIAAPWTIYTLMAYPQMAKWELSHSSSHFFTVVEGHSGDFLYHINYFDSIYGKNMLWLFLPSAYLFYRDFSNKKMAIALLVSIFSVYLFFSLAATKMPSFTILVALPIVLVFASLLNKIYCLIAAYLSPTKWYFQTLLVALLMVLFITRFHVTKIHEQHSTLQPNNPVRAQLLHNKKVFTSLRLPKNTILVNIKGVHYIDAMFYTGLPAYQVMPSLQQVQTTIAKGYRFAVFAKNQNVPDYLLNQPSTILIDEEIQGGY